MIYLYFPDTLRTLGVLRTKMTEYCSMYRLCRAVRIFPPPLQMAHVSLLPSPLLRPFLPGLSLYASILSANLNFVTVGWSALRIEVNDRDEK